jgi:hypothetical protein
MEHGAVPRLPGGELTHLPRAATTTALVLAVVVVAGVLWLRPEVVRRTDGEPVAPPPRAGAPQTPPAPAPRANAPHEETAPAPSARLPAQWRTTVGAALEAVTPPGRMLGPADRQELLDALARIRLTAGRRGRTANAAAAAKHARLVQDADRLFRDKLGMGVGEFMARLGAPGNVDDLGGARP